MAPPRPASLAAGVSRRGRRTGFGARCTCAAPFSASASRRTANPRPKSATPPRTVAVLGGGLTGLATAHYLARLLPASSRITVYEASSRTGGWIDSGPPDAPKTPPGHSPTLEAGARMVAPQRGGVRFDDLVLLELVAALGLLDRLRVSTARAAQYIYYPDHLVNVNMVEEADPDPQAPPQAPSTPLGARLRRLGVVARQLLAEPVFRGVVPALFYYTFGRYFVRCHMYALASRMASAEREPGHIPPDTESVGGYWARRMGPGPDAGSAGSRALVDNTLSALMHGIYGGDVWRLGVASSPFRGTWLREAAGPMYQAYREQMQAEDVRAQLKLDARPARYHIAAEDKQRAAAWRAGAPSTVAQASDVALLHDIAARQRERRNTRDDDGIDDETLSRLFAASATWTQFGFAGGFGTLTDALADSLRARPNVEILTDAPVTRLAYDAARQQVAVTADGLTPPLRHYDRAVSTLVSPALYRLAGGRGDGLLPGLRAEHAVTIHVVNLHYAAPGLNRPYNGFGYLIPQSVPVELNAEAALGVIFDSDRERGLRPLWASEGGDGAVAVENASVAYAGPEEEQATEADNGEAGASGPAQGTTFTVMLGGHYWDHFTPDDMPSPAEAVRMAEAVVRRHLGPGAVINSPAFADVAPAATRTKLCRECIPQHYVGHAARMADVHKDLTGAFAGRLAVAGGSFTATGPGVLPSLRSARDIALRIAGRGYRTLDGGETDMAHVGDTGLARFADPATDPVVPVSKRSVPLRFGNATRYEDGQWVVGGRRVLGEAK